MIAKAIKGKGFRGALEYELSKEEGRVIDTNMEGVGPREQAREFGAIRKLRPNWSRAVLHVSLSAAPGEMLTDDQWREIGQRYLHGLDWTPTSTWSCGTSTPSTSTYTCWSIAYGSTAKSRATATTTGAKKS